MLNAALERKMTRLNIQESLNAMAQQATHGDGNSYDVFQQRFSSLIDCAWPDHHPSRLEVLELARPMGYLTPAELEREKEETAEMGYCSHGIEPHCCPCGCGDRDPWSE